MGSQNSKSNDQKSAINGDDAGSSVLVRDNTSSYQGVRTETTESGGKKSVSGGSTTSEKPEKTPEPQEVKIPTLFEWKEGGNMVYVTGSFCSWTQFFIMSKQPDGVFKLVLDLPRGFHQYKFKVDGEWRYSNLFPIYNDHNNLNNYIDTTDAPIPVKEKEQVKKEAKPQQTSKTSKSSKPYSQYYPTRNDLNTDAPPAPQHYIHNFNLDYNTRQHLIGNKKYLNRIEQNLLSENNSFKNIAIMPHVNL